MGKRPDDPVNVGTGAIRWCIRETTNSKTRPLAEKQLDDLLAERDRLEAECERLRDAVDDWVNSAKAATDEKREKKSGG